MPITIADAIFIPGIEIGYSRGKENSRAFNKPSDTLHRGE